MKDAGQPFQPNTIDELLNHLLGILEPDDLDDIRRLDDWNEMHFGLGLFIRNQYILHDKNHPIIDDYLVRSGRYNPRADNISSYVLEVLWNQLRDKM